jgi:hypothetical protein
MIVGELCNFAGTWFIRPPVVTSDWREHTAYAFTEALVVVRTPP